MSSYYPTYPDCPINKPDTCRFEAAGSSKGLMYSPVTYNRKGEPVAGGANPVSKTIRCTTCGKQWSCTQTELQIVQGEPQVWK